eukprot:352901-Chlamydomonas_euryale.AAC.7
MVNAAVPRWDGMLCRQDAAHCALHQESCTAFARKTLDGNNLQIAASCNEGCSHLWRVSTVDPVKGKCLSGWDRNVCKGQIPSANVGASPKHCTGVVLQQIMSSRCCRFALHWYVMSLAKKS